LEPTDEVPTTPTIPTIYTPTSKPSGMICISILIIHLKLMFFYEGQPTTQPSLSHNLKSVGPVQIRPLDPKVVAAIVSVVVLAVIFALSIGIYYKIQKKRQALARQLDAEQKWRAVYGTGVDPAVVNPIAVELESAHHTNVTVDDFFRTGPDKDRESLVEMSRFQLTSNNNSTVVQNPLSNNDSTTGGTISATLKTAAGQRRNALEVQFKKLKK